ncbi:MAG: isoprenylcysteine carboxylmethyltransferase family protein [Pseudomonadota bacterium]|nr:isoprenylcysteine carboxylmethyltransferase family protein [Pseudomonadota bacterium]
MPGGTFGPRWIWRAGDALVILGVGLMVVAVVPFLRQRTSFIPRRRPTAFVRSGLYRVTRNPIYLGDVLVLTGVILHLDAPIALILVPIFAGFIARRFIRGEENALIETFGDEAKAWMNRVGRWL